MDFRLARMSDFMKTTIRTWWIEPTGNWGMGPGHDSKPAEAAIYGAAVSNPWGYLSTLAAQRLDESIVHGDHGVAAFMRDGCSIVVHEFIADSYARVSPQDMERLCHWWIAIRESPDFTNPNAEFEPIEIEYDLDIPDDLHPDFSFAAYIAEEWCPSGDWTRVKKIDDLNAVYVWEPDGKQRSMIVSYDEIEHDVAYDDRFVLGSKGTTFEELHTAFTAGIRTDPADLRMWQ